MSDPREIEGTPERAADRGDFGFDDFGGEPGEQNLADPETVEGLVRGFLTTAIGLRTQVNEGRLPPDQLAPKLDAEATQLQAIFYGRGEGFTATGWNSPSRLGRFLKQMGFNEPPHQTVSALLLHTARQALEAMKAHEDDEITEDVAKFRLDAAVEEAVDMLRGIPPEATEQAE